jgi:flagellar biosynthesis protein FlhG
MSNKQPEVIGVASGKGGVGKTTLSVNLASALVNIGKKVVLFDGDLGLANAQIALGLRSKFNISHVLSGEKDINEILIKGPSGLILVPGASGVKQMAALNEIQTSAIIQAFSQLNIDLDYLIIDMAAGISPSVLTLMEACHRRLIVVMDEPSSIADSYGTIKVISQNSAREDIYLVQNRVQSDEEGQILFKRMNDVCIKFLDQSIYSLGSLIEDESLLQALRNKKNDFRACSRVNCS